MRHGRWNLAFFTVLLVLITVVSACGGAASTPTSVPATPTPTKAAASPTAAVTAPTATAAATPTQAPAVTAAPTKAPVPTATQAPVQQPGVFKVDPKNLKVIKYLYDTYPDFSLAPKRGSVLKVTSSIAWPHLDPSRALGSGINGVLNAVYSKLARCRGGAEMTKFDPYTCEVTPDLAQSWQSSADGKTWTFSLRQGVKFQNQPPVNGREMTSDDVVFSYDYYMKSGGGSYAAAFTAVDKLEAVDKYTVRITLKAPYADFLATIPAGVQSYIIPKEIQAKDGDFTKTMVGTGPIQVKQVFGKERILYDKNPGYFVPGVPFLDGLDYNIVVDASTALAGYRAGLYHWVSLSGSFQTSKGAAAIKKDSPDSIFFETSWPQALYPMFVRLDKPPFNDIRVRRAMSLAMDRPGIIKDIYLGSGYIMAPIPWPWEFDNRPDASTMPWYAYDPQKAKALLADAGYPNGFSFTADYARGLADTDLSVPVYTDNLKAIGINMSLNPVDFTALRNLMSGKTYQSAVFGYVPSASTIDGWIYPAMYSNNSGNFAGINDPEIDKLLDAQRTEMNDAKRKDILKQLWQKEVDQVYRIPLPSLATIYFHSSKLHNALFTYQYLMPFSFGPNIEYMWVDS